MRSPFTGVVFSLELTHDINALLPLLVGAVCAEAVTVFTMKRSILTEKVARRGVHVAREYSVDVLELTPVRSVMHKDFTTLQADTPVEQVIDLYNHSGSALFGYPVVDSIGALQGFLRPKDILALTHVRTEGRKLVRDIMPESYSIAFSDEPLRVAADRMAQSDSESLPVAEPSDPQKVIGIVTREDLFAARVLWFAEEKNREKVLSIPSFSKTRRIFRDGMGKFQRRTRANHQANKSSEKSNPERDGIDRNNL